MKEIDVPTILVVDDSRFSRKLVEGAIRPSGHRVLEAADGVEALAVLEQESVDFVVTDLLMPNMNGIELLTRMRERGESLPCLVVSADIQESSREKAFSLGAVAFLKKPVKPAELVPLIDAHLPQRAPA